VEEGRRRKTHPTNAAACSKNWVKEGGSKGGSTTRGTQPRKQATHSALETDHDKLELGVGDALDVASDALDVCIVESGVDLVEDKERRRMVAELGESQLGGF
jgi:hypothetical protein